MDMKFRHESTFELPYLILGATSHDKLHIEVALMNIRLDLQDTRLLSVKS